MDHIDETLTTQSRDRKIEVSIRVALSMAKKTLNKYYDKTDHSEVYRIAMSMSPFEFRCPTIEPFLSPPPPAQAEIFRACWLGG